ncbi:unnamed protein product, partial [Cylicostephanus goldi]
MCLEDDLALQTKMTRLLITLVTWICALLIVGCLYFLAVIVHDINSIYDDVIRDVQEFQDFANVAWNVIMDDVQHSHNVKRESKTKSKTSKRVLAVVAADEECPPGPKGPPGIPGPP